MCGRYYVDDDTAREIEKIVKELDRKHRGRLSGDIHPSEISTVLTGRQTALSAELMRWGFPQYQRKGLLINARAETVLEKKGFRDSVLHRRCIIPAKHFYEWDAEKTKVAFSRFDSPILYMAGFYNCFQNEDRYIILTTAANASVEKVHDRMPLLLEREELEPWIYDDRFLDFALHRVPTRLERYCEYEQQRLELQ